MLTLQQGHGPNLENVEIGEGNPALACDDKCGHTLISLDQTQLFAIDCFRTAAAEVGEHLPGTLWPAKSSERSQDGDSDADFWHRGDMWRLL